MKKLLLFSLLSVFFLGQVSGQKKDLYKHTQSIEQAFINKDAELMGPLLADSFSIGIYNKASSLKILQPVIENYYQADSFVIKNIDEEANIVKVLCHFKDQKPFSTKLYFNGEAKLLHISLLDHLYGVNRYEPSHKVAEIPFDYIRGGIVIHLKLNDSDKQLSFLFDTGADGMGINRAVADSLGLKVAYKKQASVVGSKVQVQISANNTIHLDSVSIPGQNIAIFPKVSRDYDGLFGGNLLRRYITKVNFDKQVIELYNLGQYDNNGKGTAVPVNYTAGIPQIKAGIHLANDKSLTGWFNFDTGAGYHVILFGPAVHKHSLLDNYPVAYYSTNHSFGHTSKIVSGDFKELDLGDISLKHFMGALQVYRKGDEKWAFNSNGSIGIEIISRFNFTIDLLHKKLYLEPSRKFSQPFDLALNGLIMGFDASGQLFVKHVIAGSNAAQKGIKRGDVVLSINHMPGQMLREPSAQTHLRSSADTSFLFEIERRKETFEVELPVSVNG